MPYSLLLTCRAVHTEVEEMMYSGNHFVISRRDVKGLRALEQLSVAALRALRKLTIYLNYESCIGLCCGEVSNGSHETTCLRFNSCTADAPHDKPLQASLKIEYKILRDQWRAICRRLSGCITPERLSLYFACDCEDVGTAEQIVEPLQALPRLKHLAIRLSRRSQGSLRQLARITTLNLTGQRHLMPEQPFRFFDLPYEIQYRILEHTSLVAERPRYWTPYQHLQSEYCASSGYALATEVDNFGYGLPWGKMSAQLCFCMHAHSAYTSACECDPSHLTLFLVNRRFSRLAKQIFFSNNTFAATDDYHCDGTDVPYPAFAQGAELFLKRLPHFALSMLRSLKLGISNRAFDWRIPEDSPIQMQDRWVPIVDLLACHADLKKLSLEIYFDDDNYSNEYYWAEYLRFEASDPDRFWGKEFWPRYVQFVKPLTKLRELKGFAIYLRMPLSPSAQAECKAMEFALEETAMGPDHGRKAKGKGAGVMYFVDGTPEHTVSWHDV